MSRKFTFVVVFLFTLFAASCSRYPRGIHSPITRPVPVERLAKYNHYSPKVKKVISKAMVLSRDDLTYIFGSDTLNRGGMDCSGVIYYLLKSMRPNQIIPRDSYDMYMWLLHAHVMHHVTSNQFSSPQFSHLKPGDLLFWSGTYRTDRKPPITHVMMYLGKDKHGTPLMFGSSDGGIYKGMEMWGVSVFDFTLPSDHYRKRFVGYGCIPSFTC